jgi:hypothetical protein
VSLNRNQAETVTNFRSQRLGHKDKCEACTVHMIDSTKSLDPLPKSSTFNP